MMKGWRKGRGSDPVRRAGEPDPGSWIAWEERISTLLPKSPLHDRARLLAEIGDYAATVVREARERPLTHEEQPLANATDWLRSPVFICGVHRSGTTLLQQLLDGHRELLVLPSEATYFSSFSYVARPNPTPAGLNRFAADWLARFIDPNAQPHFKLGRISSTRSPSLLFCRRFFAWQDRLTRQEPALKRFAALLALVAAYRDVASPDAQPRMWAEKTPLNEFQIRRLAPFTNARFIHLVRNPLASLSSLRKTYVKHRLRPFDAARQAATIARSLDAADRHRQRFADRYLVVRYEDLTAEPESEMKRVCQFLQLEPAAASLVPSVGSIPAASNSSFDGGPPGVIHRPTGSVPENPADSLIVRALAARAARLHRYELKPVNRLTRWRIRLIRR
jgi:sulfotransferase family protein